MKVICLNTCFVGGRLIEKGAVIQISDTVTPALEAIYGDTSLFSGFPKKETQGASAVTSTGDAAGDAPPQNGSDEENGNDEENDDTPENESKSEVRQVLKRLAAQYNIRVTANMKDDTIRNRLKESGVDVQ